MGNVWISSAVWPSTDQAAHIVLQPEPAERPMWLFRSLLRGVVCKAAAWGALTWFEAQDVPQLNAGKGRRVGDANWTTQMKSYTSTTKRAGEIMIYLLKAFEYVSRSMLAEEGAGAIIRRMLLRQASRRIVSKEGWCAKSVCRRKSSQGGTSQQGRPLRQATCGWRFHTQYV